MRTLSIRWHRWLAIVGGTGLLLWGGSGLLHPIMATWGPQQAVFFPPSRPLDLAGAQPIHEILARAGIGAAAAVRIVAGEDRNLLQVTENPDTPRRYFRLDDGAELPDHDRAHAVFLARYYLQEAAAVRAVEWIDEFSPAYPWVNRLLPVYKVSFERPDDLSIYIYTETNAAAGVDNRFKSVLQTGFRWFHTWSWFPAEAEWARVVLIALFIGSLLALALTGVTMLVLIRRKQRAPGIRGWHRIAGYALALPLLMLTSSGLFHLVQYAAVPPAANLRLSPPVSLDGVSFPLHEQWAELSAGLEISTVSIVEIPAEISTNASASTSNNISTNTSTGRHLYRLGLAPARNAAPGTPSEIRNARFDGVERTGPALYLDAATGEPFAGGDREIALQLGERFTGVPRTAIASAELVTRFGPQYDFRNKRLPVWRLDYGAPVNATIFVDTTTGVLADRTPDYAKAEQFSFSYLHKWNFLFPLGRTAQNGIVSAAVIASLVFMAGIGLTLDIRARRRKRKTRRAYGQPRLGSRLRR